MHQVLNNPARLAALSILLLVGAGCGDGARENKNATDDSDEAYRPHFHFTPPSNWMNDPNGMVYSEGVYHFFYQYNPDSSVWGPMHWGHATSADLVHWKREPIALYPDSLGTIFSGSAVADVNNTSGFGRRGKSPLVAIFTHHNEKAEKAGRNEFQNQSLAYSLDNGKTWIKHFRNPVLRSPGIRDFRDPKVIWYQPSNKWIMSLAAGDRIIFYSSYDLKEWSKESEFGSGVGAHGGVWECPDLFPLEENGKTTWVLIVNINPGGPNKGSAAQYFLGEFDGHSFTPINKKTNWLDYGPDNYAGVTWSNTGNRKILIGWMSNWLYANVVPTTTWRNAATIPRELSLKRAGDELYLASEPVKELNSIQTERIGRSEITFDNKIDIKELIGRFQIPCRLKLKMDTLTDFSLMISNKSGDELIFGFDKITNEYYIDRIKSGKIDFHPDFGARHTAPRLSQDSSMEFTVLLDVSSIELFADGGMTVMTSVFFPRKPYTNLHLYSPGKQMVRSFEYAELKNIWTDSTVINK
ncbi:MAG TPA: glycoside hydrolase family 32 protein [Chitinophagaceae bacterium]